MVVVTPLWVSITPTKSPLLSGTKITVSGKGFDPDRAIHGCKWTSSGGAEVSVPVEATDATSFICPVSARQRRGKEEEEKEGGVWRTRCD